MSNKKILYFWDMKDDCIQEAVKRLFEVSGHPDFSKFFFRYSCAKNARFWQKKPSVSLRAMQ